MLPSILPSTYPVDSFPRIILLLLPPAPPPPFLLLLFFSLLPLSHLRSLYPFFLYFVYFILSLFPILIMTFNLYFLASVLTFFSLSLFHQPLLYPFSFLLFSLLWFPSSLPSLLSTVPLCLTHTFFLYLFLSLFFPHHFVSFDLSFIILSFPLFSLSLQLYIFMPPFPVLPPAILPFFLLLTLLLNTSFFPPSFI